MSTVPNECARPPPYFSVGQPPPAAPPHRVRRRRPRAKDLTQIHALSDAEIQHLSDTEICDAHKARSRSDVYDHYNVSLVRHMRPNAADDGTVNGKTLDYMEFAFTCKTDPARHPVQYRRRSETHQGTGNLNTSSQACRCRNGLPDCTPNQPATSPFSYAMHMAIIVMMCAYHYLPFAGVLHDLVRRHVQLLRPGTKMPDSTTVSRTTQFVYARQAEKVRSYFNDIKTIHFAIDGWTSPTATAYLGLVVHWYHEGQIWRAMLEMIRRVLEKKHTGEYLAQKTAECIQRYGLKDKLLAICMDNAGNNDTLARYLPNFIPGFGGPRSRVRCAAHVINLIVKAFTTYFIAPTRKRKSVKSKKSKTRSKRRRVKRGTASSNTLADAPQDPSSESDADEEAAISDHDRDTGDGVVDPARAEHDERIIKETLDAGLEYVRSTLGLEISELDEKAAQEILTKESLRTSKLSRMIHEKPELKHKFDTLIDSFLSTLPTDQRALARRVVTRWSSDFDCLQSHRNLRLCVEMLTSDESNGLQDVRLSEYQWSLLDHVVRVLVIFKEVTLFFSQGGIPLVHEVVPMFVTIKQKLEVVRDNKKAVMDPLVRAAAHSSLLVLEKYMNLFEDSEVYWIALVMCPDRKLQWLHDNTFKPSDINAVRDLVVHRFNALYPALHPTDSDLANNSDDEWSLKPRRGTGSSPEFDSIEKYLATEPLSPEVYGESGPLVYWQSQMAPACRPRLAEFAISYLTAPASSVDAERAFSCGRLTIGHLQHNMSPETFCAKMSLRSWYGTPLMHGIEDVAAVLELTNTEEQVV